jgi:cytochrome c oxidase subunit 2
MFKFSNLYFFFIVIIFISFLFLSCVYNDFASPHQLAFQDAATPFMEGIVDLHHDLMFIVVVVSIGVLSLMGRIIYLFTTLDEGFFGFFFSTFRNFHYEISTRTRNSNLEICWTIVPAAILIFIAVPSFALIYAIDEVIDPVLTLKIIGRQWNWVYEYAECGSDYYDRLTFESYLLPEEELESEDLRLLSVDKRIFLPFLTHVRLLITSSDVLHCWAVPSLGIKVDAVPGRLNQSSIFLKREGTFYGMCSEICGINHGFMPICVQSVSFLDFEKWVFTNDAWILIFRDYYHLLNKLPTVYATLKTGPPTINIFENIWLFSYVKSLGFKHILFQF